MARITKIELEQLLRARNAEIEALRLEVSKLRAQVSLRPAPPAQRWVNGAVLGEYTKRDGSVWQKYVADAARRVVAHRCIA